MEIKSNIVPFPVKKPAKPIPQSYIYLELNPVLVPRVRRDWWWQQGWDMTSETKIELYYGEEDL